MASAAARPISRRPSCHSSSALGSRPRPSSTGARAFTATTRAALGGKGWLLDAEVAWSQARFTPSQPGGDHVPGAVNRVASLGLTYAGPGRWLGAFELRHFGPRDLVEDGSQRSRATTLASLR